MPGMMVDDVVEAIFRRLCDHPASARRGVPQDGGKSDTCVAWGAGEQRAKEIDMRKEWGGGISWDVLVRDKFQCQYCGLDAAALGRWDLFDPDHLIPGAKGGPYTLLNLVTACMGCNKLKAGYDPSGPCACCADPLTEESRLRLIRRSKDHIDAKRARWEADFQAMLREAHAALMREHPTPPDDRERG